MNQARDPFDAYNQPFLKNQATQIRNVATDGTRRTHQVHESGLFQLARRGCTVYSIEILGSGSWGRIALFDDEDNLIFKQMSTFTGSFPLFNGYAWGGLYLHTNCGPGPHAIVTVSWNEPDRQVV